MSKIKLEILDNVSFRVADKTYPRGKYLHEWSDFNSVTIKVFYKIP